MSSAPEPAHRANQREDAARAIRYLAVKAAIFILIPMLAAALAVWWRFG